MTAGLNCLVNFIRLTYTTDDDVGGADPTGTFVFQNVNARIVPLSFNGMNPSVLLQDQGLETRRPLSCMVWPGTLAIREEDELVVVSPPNHRYYNQTFRIITLEYAGHHPDQKRQNLLLTIERSDISHRNEIQ